MINSTNIPRVSIGLAVFNGENYLKETLESILNQTYRDFELIIIDNASFDQTPQICRDYAEKDKRIKYYRNKVNLGAVKSHNMAFELALGLFFKWAAHDDVLAPDYLLKCVSVLDSDPSIVVCHSKTGIINEESKNIGVYSYAVRTNSMKPHERYGDLIVERLQPSWVLIFGVIRSDVLRMTSLMGNYIGSDFNLLVELSLIGRIYEIPEILFYRRSHPSAYGNRAKKGSKNPFTYPEKNAWWTQNNVFSFHRWTILNEYFKAVKKSPLVFYEKLLCYSKIFKWIWKNGWIFLCEDLIVNFLYRSRLGNKINPVVKNLLDVFGGYEL